MRNRKLYEFEFLYADWLTSRAIFKTKFQAKKLGRRIGVEVRLVARLPRFAGAEPTSHGYVSQE